MLSQQAAQAETHWTLRLSLVCFGELLRDTLRHFRRIHRELPFRVRITLTATPRSSAPSPIARPPHISLRWRTPMMRVSVTMAAHGIADATSIVVAVVEVFLLLFVTVHVRVKVTFAVIIAVTIMVNVIEDGPMTHTRALSPSALLHERYEWPKKRDPTAPASV